MSQMDEHAPWASQGDRIRRLRLDKGWSMAELARCVNTSKQTIDKIERGESLKSRYLPEIARELGVSLEEINPKFADGAQPSPPVRSRRADRASDPAIVRDLPVYGCAEASDGTILITFQPIDYLRRPTPLLHVEDAYAVLMDGSTMVPALEPGDLALINPRLFPRRGMSALFLGPEDQSVRAMARRYEGQNERNWKVFQWQPSRQLTIDKKDWPRVHTVVGKYCWR